MIKYNVGGETYCKGCSSPFRSCYYFFGMARNLGSASIGKHSVGYCLFVNACCASHRAKPRSQINPSDISRGTGMVWPNPLMAWELDPCKLFPAWDSDPGDALGGHTFPAQGPQGWNKPWGSRVLWRPVWNVWPRDGRVCHLWEALEQMGKVLNSLISSFWNTHVEMLSQLQQIFVSRMDSPWHSGFTAEAQRNHGLIVGRAQSRLDTLIFISFVCTRQHQGPYNCKTYWVDFAIPDYFIYFLKSN